MPSPAFATAADFLKSDQFMEIVVLCAHRVSECKELQKKFPGPFWDEQLKRAEAGKAAATDAYAAAYSGREGWK